MAATALQIPNDEPEEVSVPTETHALFLRISEEDRAGLEALAERLPLKSTAIARIAIHIGIDELMKNPALILEAKKRPKAKRAKPKP